MIYVGTPGISIRSPLRLDQLPEGRLDWTLSHLEARTKIYIHPFFKEKKTKLNILRNVTLAIKKLHIKTTEIADFVAVLQ